MSQLELAYRHEAQIQHYKRYQKAVQAKDTVTFTVAVERSIMPSSKQGEKPYAIKFSRPYNCECMSFIHGCARDPNFQCYHIMASILRWNEVCSVNVLPRGVTHPPTQEGI